MGEVVSTHGRPLRCLYATSEVAGLAKTGGLADVAAALPAALARRGHCCAVLLPLYHSVRHSGRPLFPTNITLTVPLGTGARPARLWRTSLPDSEVPVYLVEEPELFERDDPAQGRGLYQYRGPDGRPCDYADNLLRFAFFSRAVCEAARQLEEAPEILHLNEWQTALAAVYVREFYRQPGLPSLHTLLTIHNLAYQGIFPAEQFPITGLPWRLFHWEQLEFYGRLNCLKGGIVFADLLNTVSPTYAREIQTSLYGEGLHGVLRARARQLVGILNGVDYRIWDPAHDRHLPVRYTVATAQEGKAACKRALQERCGLPCQTATPLLGVIGRLVEQKGIDLLLEILPVLLADGVQLVLLGQGNLEYHERLQEIQRRFPQQVYLCLAHDEVFAHWLYAGADLFLIPSRFEPCGLVQLYALRYGAVPVVRATGGLADTVVDACPATLAAGTATGFTFGPPAASFFWEAVQRALACYRQRPQEWWQLVRTGMTQDWSWDRSAQAYEELYYRLLGLPAGSP
jgi:starch synthase